MRNADDNLTITNDRQMELTAVRRGYETVKRGILGTDTGINVYTEREREKGTWEIKVIKQKMEIRTNKRERERESDNVTHG